MNRHLIFRVRERDSKTERGRDRKRIFSLRRSVNAKEQPQNSRSDVEHFANIKKILFKTDVRGPEQPFII